MLLQVALPGGLELLVVLLVAGILTVLSVVVSVYIYRDATARGLSHPLAIAVGAFLGGFWVWIIYYLVRDEVGPRD